MSATLIIGNKNYSSWSLRAWFFLKYHAIPFEEIRIPLYREDSKQKLLTYSPSGKVPVLIDGETRIWDSLAILEYLAETRPNTQGWPTQIEERAVARSLAAEMHSGFQSLRANCGMNCRRAPRVKTLPEDTYKDIARIREIWQVCRSRSDNHGPWLLGAFSILDAMYAPVVLRFHQYQLDAGITEKSYMSTVLNHPSIQEWIKDGQREAEIIQKFED
jgi:glutathione S-transferase